MKIRTRILISFFCISLLSTWLFSRLILSDLRSTYLEAVEEPLVDASQVLAELYSSYYVGGRFRFEGAENHLDNIYSRRLEARIYQLVKTNINLRIYITDNKGIVVYDSFKRDLGKDFSPWNDVHLTLKGEYGARATRVDPDDENTVVLYVAAPVRKNGEVIGVLSVGKPAESISFFVVNSKRKIMLIAVSVLLVSLLMTWLLSLFITRGIRKLTEYNLAIRDNRQAALPRLGRDEIGMLGRSLEEMKLSLEGRKYIENYVQTLAHEIKSPLSGIKGGAELLSEDMPEADRRRFIRNIQEESARIEDILDRLLRLSSVENISRLDKPEDVDLGILLKELTKDFKTRFDQEKIALYDRTREGLKLKGDRFLIRHSIANVLQNALDFTRPNGMVSFATDRTADSIVLIIENDGESIPDYALDRIFDKFYSLERPQGGKKSSGLGLSFVSRAMELHGGSVTVRNREAGGVKVGLSFPAD